MSPEYRIFFPREKGALIVLDYQSPNLNFHICIFKSYSAFGPGFLPFSKRTAYFSCVAKFYCGALLQVLKPLRYQ